MVTSTAGPSIVTQDDLFTACKAVADQVRDDLKKDLLGSEKSLVDRLMRSLEDKIPALVEKALAAKVKEILDAIPAPVVKNVVNVPTRKVVKSIEYDAHGRPAVITEHEQGGVK